MKQAVIESGRAEFALNMVKQVMVDYPHDSNKKEAELTGEEKANMKTQKEYKSYVKKFPSLVFANGLAASIAFAYEKGGGKKGGDVKSSDGRDSGRKSNDKKESGNQAWKRIYDNVSDWLIKNGYGIGQEGLITYICSLDSDTYRMVTNEVLSLFVWMKRLAGGLIEGEADE